MPTGHYRFRRSFGNVGSIFRGARPDTFPLFTGLLDDFGGAAAAYSLRALSRNWVAGDVVKVRRSSFGGGPAELDFTASDYLNGVLLAWVTEFSGIADGFVSTWYDQSGEGNNATQATTTAQPKIVSAGSLVVGGLDFDGTDDVMDIPMDIITSIDSVSSFVVSRLNTTGGIRVSLALSRNNPDKRYYSPILLGGDVNLGYGASASAIVHGL